MSVVVMATINTALNIVLASKKRNAGSNTKARTIRLSGTLFSWREIEKKGAKCVPKADRERWVNFGGGNIEPIGTKATKTGRAVGAFPV
jgi:hypothetical protein